MLSPFPSSFKKAFYIIRITYFTYVAFCLALKLFGADFLDYSGEQPATLFKEQRNAGMLV